MDIRSKVQSYPLSTKSRNLKEFVKDTGNIYETLVIMSKRANMVAQDLKMELKDKLEEFAVSGDAIEEVQENKEQIEISKLYEKLPNSAIIAIEEFLHDELSVKRRQLEEESEDIDR